MLFGNAKWGSGGKNKPEGVERLLECRMKAGG